MGKEHRLGTLKMSVARLTAGWVIFRFSAALVKFRYSETMRNVFIFEPSIGHSILFLLMNYRR